MNVVVVPMRQEDILDVVALQRGCYPPPFPAELLWRPEHLAHHLEVFPAGQFVARTDGRVVGSASALRVPDSVWEAQVDWEATTGGHFFAGHDPDGSTLYGADVSVHPDARRAGVGRALYAARYDFVRRHGLARYGTACRLPGFRAWAACERGAVAAYVAAVTAGEASDPTLTPLLRYGLRPIAVKRGFMDDPESGDAACVLEWTP